MVIAFVLAVVYKIWEKSYMATKPKKITKKFVNKKSYGKSLSFRAPPALLAKLKAATKRQCIPMGTLLRELVEGYYGSGH